ncbi:MAG: glycoside hydrolase family 43 protein [Marinilabiliaceae bacterium]|nr:glycoside hydrolase family 43 protein [Marinilabiliaceae bacterium]
MKHHIYVISCFIILMLSGISCKEKSPKENLVFSHYLFAYFSNNSPDGEQIRFAISEDGFNYKPLNEGEPVIGSDTVAIKHGIRDPHLLRGEDGKTFLMVGTDMRCKDGWHSNEGLVLLKSRDLINWEHKAIDFPTRFAYVEGLDAENLHAVWAPQVIWDSKVQKYMVYYALGRYDQSYKVGGRTQPYFKLYYSYANDDFTDISEPRLLFDFGTAAIDGDIIYDDLNKEYVLFFKDEGYPTDNNGFHTGRGILRATSKQLTGPYASEFRHLNVNNRAVEGSSVFRLINSNEYVLMYDCYRDGHFQFCKSSDLQQFTFVQNSEDKDDFTPRHGSVIHITKEEAQRLLKKWGASTEVK